MATVVVQIAVAVDPSGRWNAAGWSQSDSQFVDEEGSMDMAVDGLGQGSGEARYWVTAVLHVPEAEIVAGDAVKVSATSGARE